MPLSRPEAAMAARMSGSVLSWRPVAARIRGPARLPSGIRASAPAKGRTGP